MAYPPIDNLSSHPFHHEGSHMKPSDVDYGMKGWRKATSTIAMFLLLVVLPWVVLKFVGGWFAVGIVVAVLFVVILVIAWRL